jgi:hypothetical protein
MILIFVMVLFIRSSGDGTSVPLGRAGNPHNKLATAGAKAKQELWDRVINHRPKVRSGDQESASRNQIRALSHCAMPSECDIG